VRLKAKQVQGFAESKRIGFFLRDAVRVQVSLPIMPGSFQHQAHARLADSRGVGVVFVVCHVGVKKKFLAIIQKKLHTAKIFVSLRKNKSNGKPKMENREAQISRCF
jgi:hypothetical protein